MQRTGLRLALTGCLVWLAHVSHAQPITPEQVTPLQWLGQDTNLSAGDVGSLFLAVDLPAPAQIRILASESTIVWLTDQAGLACGAAPRSGQSFASARATKGASVVKVCFSSTKPSSFSLVATLTEPLALPANHFKATASPTVTINSETFWVSPLITTAIPMLIAFFGGLASTYGSERIKLGLEDRRSAQEADAKTRKFLVERLLPELAAHHSRLAGMVNVRDGDVVPERLSMADLNEFNGMVELLRSFTGRVGDARVVDAVAHYVKRVVDLNEELNVQDNRPTSFVEVRKLAAHCNEALAAVMSRRN